MAVAAVKPDVRFERATGTVGAHVRGVGLGDARCQATAAILHRAIHEHGVLFFEFGRYLGDDEYFEFGHLFGEPSDAFGFSQKGVERGKDPKSYVDSIVTPMAENRINCWHSDGAPFEFPPQTAMLTPVVAPEVGGDTMWASMYAAWDALSPAYQALLEDAQVLNSTARVPRVQPSMSRVHPAVIRDPVTGRKMLYVNSNYAERVVGMSDRESEALLQMLFEHVNTPEFHVRLRWRPGVVAVWDQRVTQHRGVADFTCHRKLRRLNYPGAPLVAV